MNKNNTGKFVKRETSISVALIVRNWIVPKMLNLNKHPNVPGVKKHK